MYDLGASLVQVFGNYFMSHFWNDFEKSAGFLPILSVLVFLQSQTVGSKCCGQGALSPAFKATMHEITMHRNGL